MYITVFTSLVALLHSFFQAHEDFYGDEDHKHQILSMQVYAAKPSLHKKKTCEHHKNEYVAVCCEKCYLLACAKCKNGCCAGKRVNFTIIYILWSDGIQHVLQWPLQPGLDTQHKEISSSLWFCKNMCILHRHLILIRCLWCTVLAISKQTYIPPAWQHFGQLFESRYSFENRRHLFLYLSGKFLFCVENTLNRTTCIE